MLIKSVVCFLWMFVGIETTQAQVYTVSGYVKDAQTGETLIGATIQVQGTNKSVQSNAYGFYSLSLPVGKTLLTFSYIGYQSNQYTVELDADKEMDVVLERYIREEEAVVVSTSRRESNVHSTQMGKISMPIEQIKAVPSFMGEVDLLKVVQLVPGVRNAGEGSSGIYVRGGGADQNLIILDDAVVYNPGHLFGFFSVFNSDAVKNVQLYKGGIPAQYGGRLSSVLDITMKDGNNRYFQTEGGIGLIASRFSVQGPIKKNVSSFIVSGRRTYVDALIKPFISKESQYKGSGYYFYDLNAKLNYIFNHRNRLYLSGYFGRDVFDFVNGRQSLKVNIPWGNTTATLRWNLVFNNKLFANTTALYNDYKFNFTGVYDNTTGRLSSGIRDLSLKHDVDYYPSPAHKVKAGFQYIYHRFTPSVVSGTQDTIEFKPNVSQIKYAHEGAIYLQDDYDIATRIKLHAGLRYSFFQQTGPHKRYVTDADGNRTDSTVYGNGQPIQTYGGWEPRVSIRYTLHNNASLKASFTQHYQYIHLVSNSGSTLPTDLWVPSTYTVQPQRSLLYALGYFKNFSNGMYETSVEVYYKDMHNQIEYREGYTPRTLEDTETQFVFGKGYSYGVELYVNKTRGNLTGWMGYTLSKTDRKFPLLNEGKKFPAKFDRRHDLSVVAIYTLNNRWKLSASFIYGSGNAATLPQRFYIMEGVISQEYSRINQHRLPSYHRLDVSATLTPKRNPKRKWHSEWVFSIYNLYSRQNPYFIYFDQEGDPQNGTFKIQAKQVSLFPILPSVTWNFRFPNH